MAPESAAELSKDRDDQVKLDRWSDALQRSLELPAELLWVAANLAAEADRLNVEDMTPELQAWIYRAEAMVSHPPVFMTPRVGTMGRRGGVG